MTGRKFWDIDHPPVVVLVGEGDRALERALDSGTGFRVERVAGAAAALERLDERPAVECLWVGELPDADGLELVEAAAERDPATGVVFAPADGDVELATRATTAGACTYVATGTALDRRVEVVETAVERATARRHDAEKRSALDAMLTELDVTLYAKDERARHVLFADTEGTPDPGQVFGEIDPDAYPDHREELRESYRDDLAVIEDGERIDGKLEHYPDADQWMLTTKVPWTDEGRSRGLVGVTLDVTEFKQRERELVQHVARLQGIPDYLDHDLRNPLNTAQGYLELARVGEETALDEVEESLDRMAVLLDNFRSLATRTARERTDRPVRLRALVEDVWAYVDADGAALELAVPPDARVVANDERLRPVVKNLLDNAVEHAGPEVTVRVGLLEDGFYVEDDGPGIPREVRERVFEQGYTTAADGTGLGLAIVRDGATRHGWDVSVTDGDLGGTRVRVTGCLVGTPLAVTRGEGRIDLVESVDVGDVDHPGESAGADGSFAVTGAGENIWGHVNEFHFLHAAVDGDVRVQGRVAEVERAGEWSKAGLMVRSTLDPDAAYGFVGRVADRCPEVGWRTEPESRGRNRQLEGVEAGHEWFRLDRVGDQVACSFSTDGETWRPIDRRTVDLGESVAVGLAVCSTVAGEPITGRFEGVEVLPLDG